MGSWRAALFASLVVVVATTASASVTCEQASGTPPDDTLVRIVIDSPADGDVIQPRNACGGKVIVSGSYVVHAPPLQYDFYIVIDTSGSTASSSGADVNRNGTVGDLPGDSIYEAEIQAAEDFINALNWSASRVAVISFSGSPTLRQPLTSDLAAAIAVLETMRGGTPGGGTIYTSALEMVRQEMLTRGDLVNRLQHGVFLSDGQPQGDPEADIEAKATELARLGMRMDTFALGAIDSTSLRAIASITRGTFTALATPGDIVGLLPSFVPDTSYTFDSTDVTTGMPGLMVLDEGAGTFQAIVNVVPGSNQITLTLTALGTPPITVTCSINVTVGEALFPDAGPSVEACPRQTRTLDASRSTGVCTPIFRWLDCNGAPLSTWSTTPTLDVEPCQLACETVTLEQSCEGDACSKTATTVARCLAVAPPIPALVASCATEASLTCGVTDPSLDVDWDLDPARDSDGDGDPTDDLDASGCDVTHDFGSLGDHDAYAWVSNPATGCSTFERITFTLDPNPAPRNMDNGACNGTPLDFSCGTPVAGLTYWWDFDETVDSDFDGNPRNDHDADGCDVERTWATSGRHEVHGWSSTTSGCLDEFGAGTVTIAPGATPGEVTDLRVTKAGADGVHLTWTMVPGADYHRVLRGTVLPLQRTGAYDHVADDATGRGACQVIGADNFTDPDDQDDPTAFYYLITAYNDCGGEGPTGQGNDNHQRFDRPPRLPSLTCP
jgi:hypothetical protein